MKLICLIFLIIMICLCYENNKKQNSKDKNQKNKYETIRKFLNEIHEKENNKNIFKRTNDDTLPEISIIVPVYNKEKYLLTAIRSIQKQDFYNFELILVDDGSTDSSLEIMLKEQEKDKRLVVIQNKINRGTFFSRVNGTFHSKGKYITFLDPDDSFCRKDAFSLIYNQMRLNNYDIIHYQALMYNKQKQLQIYKNAGPKINHPLFTHSLRTYHHNYALWDKLYRREMLLKAFSKLGDRINKRLVHTEDRVLSTVIFQTADSYYPFFEPIIWYNDFNKDSITYKRFIGYKHYKDKNSFLEKIMFDKTTSINWTYELVPDTSESKFVFDFTLKQLVEDSNTIEVVKSTKNEEFKKRIFEICNRFLNNKFLSSKTNKLLTSFCKKLDIVKEKPLNSDL